MARRLTRKEIKRDEVLETFEAGIEFVQDNLKVILGGIAAVIGVVLLTVAFFTYRNSQERQAGELLGQAVDVLEAPLAGTEGAETATLRFPDAASRKARAAEILEQLRADYGGTRAGGIAELYSATWAAEEGRLDEAKAIWERQAKKGDNLLSAQAWVNLLQLQRDSGAGEEAEQQLRAMLDDKSRPLPEDMVLFELGSTLEALERDDEAEEFFQRIVDQFPRSPYASEARQRVQPSAGVPAGFGGA